MRYSPKQINLYHKLENLSGLRFSIEKLNKHLTELCGEPIEVSDTTDSKDEDDVSDWNLLFNIKNEELYGYVDIYYLKMRKPGFDNDTIYITEVSVEFE